MEDNINNNDQPWGRKGTLPYTLACMVKSRPSLMSNLTTKREGKVERCFLLVLAGQSRYLCRVCPICVGLSRLGGGTHPTALSSIIRSESSQNDSVVGVTYC